MEHEGSLLCSERPVTGPILNHIIQFTFSHHLSSRPVLVILPAIPMSNQGLAIILYAFFFSLPCMLLATLFDDDDCIVLYCGRVLDALQPKAYCTNPGL